MKNEAINKIDRLLRLDIVHLLERMDGRKLTRAIIF